MELFQELEKLAYVDNEENSNVFGTTSLFHPDSMQHAFIFSILIWSTLDLDSVRIAEVVSHWTATQS